jgi:hypothetical protein
MARKPAKKPARKSKAAAPSARQTPSPQAPTNRPHGMIEDRRQYFADVTKKTPVDQKFRQAFVRNKMLIAQTHPTLDLGVRALAVDSLVARLGPQAKALSKQPVPGGVGYGAFYTAAYKTGWGHGTSFACDFICPTPPGGNVTTWLYLTATNRSALGVEAFVSYNGQSDTHFRVFDWARSDHWQTDCPFSALGNYIRTDSAHGNNYQVLPVWNSTWMIGANRWRNQALLYNHVRGGWDLMYQYDYTATESAQKTGWIGSWGPIVETFQPSYNHTNPMGALATYLIGANNSGVWGAWALLSASNSTIRDDHVGFHLLFLDPNYAFAVNS